MVPSLPKTFVESELVENQAYKYLSLAQAVWYTYDWLLSISEEYEVANGLSWPTAIYFASRVSTFGLMLCLMLYSLAPGGILGCTWIAVMFLTFGCLAGACTSFLFFICVRAVYLCSRSITATFGALWIATIALNLPQYRVLYTEHIAGSPSCGTVDSFSILLGLPNIGNTVYDTLVFLAISYRLAVDAVTAENGWRTRLQPLVNGESCYAISSALMRSGQLYYFGRSTTILALSANFVLMFSSLAPTAYHSFCIYAVSSFANIMACRVFRSVALEAMGADDSVTGVNTTSIGMAAALQLATLPSSRGSMDSHPGSHMIRPLTLNTALATDTCILSV